MLFFFFFLSYYPFIGIHSDTFILFQSFSKRRGSTGIIIIIISRKTVKITSGFSILIRNFYSLINNLMRGNSKGHCPAH